MTSPPLAQQLPRVSALPDLEPAISLRGVSKRYGRELALHSLDLDIADGEFFCLLGPSGCGKTTTLNLLGGFVTPTSGQIFIRGTQVDRLPPYRRDVNTVFQSYALFPHMASASCSSLYWPRLRVGRTTPLRPPPAPCRSTPASPTRPRC